MDNFITPPNHVHFLAKKLFGEMGEVLDGSIAYLEPGGGGPVEPHTHPHDHLFIVVKGEAIVRLEDKEIIIKENDSYLVKGALLHSAWNNSDETTIMIGLSMAAK